MEANETEPSRPAQEKKSKIAGYICLIVIVASLVTLFFTHQQIKALIEVDKVNEPREVEVKNSYIDTVLDEENQVVKVNAYNTPEEVYIIQI